MNFLTRWVYNVTSKPRDKTSTDFLGYYLALSAEELDFLEEINLTAGRTGDLTPEAAEFSTELAEKIVSVRG